MTFRYLLHVKIHSFRKPLKFIEHNWLPSCFSWANKIILERKYIQNPSRSFNCRHRNTPEKVFIGFYRYVFLVQMPPQEVFGCIGQCQHGNIPRIQLTKKTQIQHYQKTPQKHPCPSISTCKPKNKFNQQKLATCIFPPQPETSLHP